MVAVRHLVFSKIRILSNGTHWASDFLSLYQIWRKNVDRRRNYGRKSKSKMAAVRHFGFVTSSYRTTHEVYSLGYIGLSNFMLIRCIVLKIWRFEFFCRFGFKCLFTPPKFWFLGVRTPKRDWSSSRPPKVTSLAETALTCQFWWRSVAWCDLCVSRRNQKKEKKGKERNLQWQTGCSPRPPTLTQRCGLACRVVFGR